MDTAEMLRLWIETKSVEDEAKNRRYELEQALSEIVESKVDGSKTSTIEGFKVTVKRPVYYSLDIEQWESVKDTIPADKHPTRTKIEVDAKKYKELEEFPALWDTAASCITAKPGKIEFTIKEVE
jgi:hypothetical protein